MRLRCKLGRHRWARLGTTTWLGDPPRPSRNDAPVAMEFRRCRDCAAVTDVSTFTTTVDRDTGCPVNFGPLAAAEVRRIIARPPAQAGDTHAE